MSGDLLYGLSLWTLALLMMVLLMAVTEGGFRAGSKALFSLNDSAKSQIGVISGAILGLLALLLGFTFAMAQTRFDRRQQLVTEEANDIGTTYLRAGLLPDPYRTDVSALLRNYVDARVSYYGGGGDESRLKAVHERTKELQNQLWSNVAGAVAKDDRVVTTGLFIESLNNVIDDDTKRFAAMQNHVPEVVLFLLFTVALVAALAVGYGCGTGKHRHLFSTTMMSLLIVLVITVIMDLDRPRRGFIRVSQSSMIRLQESLGKASP